MAYGKKDLFQSVENLQKENDELKTKLSELEEENIKMKLEQVEYNDLKELYKIDNVYSSYEKIGANVIGRNSDSWYDTFIIDKGSADGIEVDMNVIAGNGLVGIVYKVSENIPMSEALLMMKVK